MDDQKVMTDVYTIRIPTGTRRVESPFCEACKNGVVHLSSLEVRQFTQSGKLPNVCKTCNKEFLKICRIQIRNMSNRSSLHLCNVCNKTFIHAGNLKKHMEAHADPSKKAVRKKLSITPQKEVNGQVQEVVKKSEEIEKIDDTGFLEFENRKCVCKNCDKEISNEYCLMKHCQFHTYNRQSNVCSCCNLLFENVDSFKAHMTSHEEECQYICNICSITFTKISALKDHCVDKHKQIIPQNESAIQNNGDKPLFQCHICPKNFIRKAAYIRHCELHDSPNSFACHICSKVFTTANRLRIHQSKHHKTVKSPKKMKSKLKFSCKKCNKSFEKRKTYAKHKATHR